MSLLEKVPLAFSQIISSGLELYRGLLLAVLQALQVVSRGKEAKILRSSKLKSLPAIGIMLSVQKEVNNFHV